MDKLQREYMDICDRIYLNLSAQKKSQGNKSLDAQIKRDLVERERIERELSI